MVFFFFFFFFFWFAGTLAGWALGGKSRDWRGDMF
jgi:hypothetical protein